MRRVRRRRWCPVRRRGRRLDAVAVSGAGAGLRGSVHVLEARGEERRVWAETVPTVIGWAGYAACAECGVDARRACRTDDDEVAETPCEGRPMAVRAPSTPKADDNALSRARTRIGVLEAQLTHALERADRAERSLRQAERSLTAIAKIATKSPDPASQSHDK